MIIDKNEDKFMAKHVSQNSKCKLNNTACNSDQKWSNMNVKIIGHAKKIIIGILAHVFMRMISI